MIINVCQYVHIEYCLVLDYYGLTGERRLLNRVCIRVRGFVSIPKGMSASSRDKDTPLLICMISGGIHFGCSEHDFIVIDEIFLLRSLIVKRSTNHFLCK